MWCSTGQIITVKCLILFLKKIYSNLYCSKIVDDFVLEMGKLEKNSAKRKKILALELNDEEWKRVGLFCDLLSVSKFLNTLYDIHTSFSMPTFLNKHSQLIDLPLSTTPFLQLKLCMQHGVNGLLKTSMLRFEMHWSLRLPSSSNIIRRLPLLMPTLWQWVRKIKCLSVIYLFLSLVLHPGKKLLHFQKYWKKPETEEVIELIKQKVKSFY